MTQPPAKTDANPPDQGKADPSPGGESCPNHPGGESPPQDPAGAEANLLAKEAGASLAARTVAILVRGYQLTLSPFKRMLLGPTGGCRFSPTCSEYARQAILKHGLFKGGWLAARRILKCGPWHPGGHDAVP